ncbi:MAG: aspartate/glutamate racemase family protein [Intrasporangium sp.]|nr:aspartate/glutamate racemase family protein [Intrasporangium sp.]
MALVDSGVGLVAYADALLALRPDLGLILSMDPDHMPYGPRTPEHVRHLILGSARACLPYQPDALVVACNTASVHGLEALRAALEPQLPVIGTVPAIRPAAMTGGPVAVWATRATTGSDYLRGLVDAFAADIETHAVTANGLAEAIERGELDGVDACIREAAAATPPVKALVLGCTHYGLVADRIAEALGDVRIFDSPVAVARQTLRRLGLEPDAGGSGAAGSGAGGSGAAESVGGVEAVLLSARPGELPEAMLAYPAGRRLAAHRLTPVERAQAASRAGRNGRRRDV